MADARNLMERIAEEYLTAVMDDDDVVRAVKEAVASLPIGERNLLLTYADLGIMGTSKKFKSSYRMTRRAVDTAVDKVRVRVFAEIASRRRLDAMMRAYNDDYDDGMDGF